MGEEEKFLSRWARRKEEARAGTLQEGEPASAGEKEHAAKPNERDQPAVEDAADHPAAGIDIDALDASSDFKVFMHEKVPQAVRRQALRKLWFGDPVFSELDGLNDYDDDFTDAATVVQGLKAAYDESVRRMKEQEAREAEQAAADGGGDERDEATEETASAEGEIRAQSDEETRAGGEDPDDGTDEA